MKKLGLAVATIAMAGIGLSAHADGKSQASGRPAVKPAVKKYNPLLKCDSMEFRIRGGGFQPGIGVFELKGDGDVSRRTGKEYIARYHCTDLDSNRPVDVLAVMTMGSKRGIAPRLAIGYFELEGKSDIIFRGHADDLGQEYVAGGAQIAWGIGVGIQTMQIDNEELSLVLKVKPVFGAGLNVGFSTVKVYPMVQKKRFGAYKRLTDID